MKQRPLAYQVAMELMHAVRANIDSSVLLAQARINDPGVIY